MRPRRHPSCPTHQLMMYELAREAQELTRIMTQWAMAAGTVTKHTDGTPKLRLGVPYQPATPRKASTSP